MMREMLLIDSSVPNVTPIAFLKDGQLCEFYYDFKDDEGTFGNIYLGKVVNSIQSLSAYFVDYGSGRNGFLPFTAAMDGLKRDDMVIVQVCKAEKDAKGARLTCFIRLIGEYYTYMPFNTNKQQYDIKQSSLEIVKYKNTNTKSSILEADLKSLHTYWLNIEKQVLKSNRPTLLHKELSLIQRLLRDRYRSSPIEILIDGHELYKSIQNTIIQSNLTHEVREYKDCMPIFEKFGIAKDILNLASRTIQLPSGGTVSIDTTEAMVCMDINSSSCKNGRLEETSYKVNLEAAEELARQIRLRDLSGIIAIDFIDMQNPIYIQNVEKRMNELMKHDHVIIRSGKLNEFGVFMMSRQRSHTSLYDQLHSKCPTCLNVSIQSIHSLAFHVFSAIRLSVHSNQGAVIKVECDERVLNYIQNYMRRELVALETRDTRIIINQGPINTFKINPAGISPIPESVPELRVANKPYDLYQLKVFAKVYTSIFYSGNICTVYH